MLRKIVFILTLIIIWQILALLDLYNQVLLPSPTDISKALVNMMLSGGLLIDIIMSLKRVIIGFIIATILGSTLAIILLQNKTVAEYISAIIEIIRPIPPIAWIPIAILWFGIGDKPAFFIVTLGSFFPIFVNLFEGVRQVEPKFLTIAKSFDAPRSQVLRDIYFPLSLPYLISGMRIGLGVAWMSVITAELVGAQNGLGYMMQLNRVLLQTQNVMAGMLIVGVLGFGLNRLMIWVEKLALPWQQDHQT